MLCAALYTRVKQGGTIPSQRMPKDRLIDELIFLSTLLSNEFVFGTKGIVQNSEETLKRLEVGPTSSRATRASPDLSATDGPSHHHRRRVADRTLAPRAIHRPRAL